MNTTANMESSKNDTQRGQIWINRVLVLLIAVGVICRFIGLNWDSGLNQLSYNLHPDERFITDLVTRLRGAQSLDEFFHSSISPLNPLNLENVNLFVYGQLPLFIVKIATVVLGRSHYSNFDDTFDNTVLVGRFVSALFDTGTVAVLYLIVRQNGSTVLGLVAAALYALCALAIQHSHFFVVDTFATFFITTSFYFGTHALKDNTRARWWILCGAMWGAALACKISMILFAPIAALLLIFAWKKPVQFRRIFLCGFLFFAASFLAFRIGHPMAFQGEAGPMGGFFDVRLPVNTIQDVTGNKPSLIGKILTTLLSTIAVEGQPNSFWQSVAQQKGITDGGEVPFNFQWVGHDHLAFPLRNWLVWGTGPLLGFIGFGGVLFVVISATMRVLKKSSEPPVAFILAALWVLLIFGYHAVQFSKFTRYFLPVTPLLCLCAALLLRQLKTELPTRFQMWPVAICLAATTCWALAVTSIYTQSHTRVIATNWIQLNIAPGTVIADETAWDDALPLGGNPGYEKINLSLEETDSPEKRLRMLDALNRAEWIFLTSQRQWSNIPRVTGRFPLTTEFYRALFNGKLGFEPAQQWTSFPKLFSIPFPDASFEEALSVYDHPPVILFRKTGEYSPQRAGQILNLQLLQNVDTRSLRDIHQSTIVNERELPQPNLQ